jgi:ABC-2 type transport system permease protein
MSGWAAVRLVIAREFITRVRTRTYRVSTLVMLLSIGAVLVLPKLLGATSFTVGVVGSQAHAVAESARAEAHLAKITITVRTLPDNAIARQQAGRGTVNAALTSDGRIVTRQYLPDQLKPFLLGAVQQAELDSRLRRAGVDPQLLAVPPPPVESLRPDSPAAEQRRNISRLGLILLFGQLIGYGTQVAFGVGEEKSSRVIEVLLATIKPLHLLVGKVLGIGLVGLLQLTTVSVAAAGFATRTGTIDVNRSTVATIGQLLVWYVLAFGFFAFLYAAVASTVSRTEDVGQVTTPLSTLTMGCLLLGLYAASNPTSALTSVLSYLPPFSPLVMPPRWAGGETALWQVLTSMAIMMLAIAGVAWIGARIYRGSILRIGTKVRLRDALTAARH